MKTPHRSRRHFCLASLKASALALLGAGLPASALTGSGPRTARFLLLHTNDIHDHLRPGSSGSGGLSYISGFIRHMRRKRDDILLIDAGDVTEKGDLVAFLAHGSLTFEAMGKIGYDAIAIGNHDHNLARDYPPQGWHELDKLHEFHELSGNSLLALNLVDPQEQPLFPPSRTFTVNGLEIAVIGMVLPRPEGTLDFETSGQALAAKARQLKQGCHLVIVSCHVGSDDSARWSQMAPEVDVFVSGHTHEVLHQPIRVPATGALIVQAGANAMWVGELELEVDLEQGGIVDHRGKLHAMKHDTVPVDKDMLQWVRHHEQRLYPDAGDTVTELSRPIGWFAIARLAAEAFRHKAGADIGLCHPTHIVRNALAAGPIDVNTLFRTSSDRGHPLVRTRLTGEEVEAYLNGLAGRDLDRFGQTQWAGFSLTWDSANRRYHSDLSPKKTYSVVLPQREWEKRFHRLIEDLEAEGASSPLTKRPFTADDAAFSYIDALKEYLQDLQREGLNVHQALQRLQKRQGAADPHEARLEPGYIRRLQTGGR